MYIGYWNLNKYLKKYLMSRLLNTSAILYILEVYCTIKLLCSLCTWILVWYAYIITFLFCDDSIIVTINVYHKWEYIIS